MSIPFTQFLRPNGARRKMIVDLPEYKDGEYKAWLFIKAGGWFEIEELSTGMINMTACYCVEGEDLDIAQRVVNNGPNIPKDVYELVLEANAWLANIHTYQAFVDNLVGKTIQVAVPKNKS